MHSSSVTKEWPRPLLPPNSTWVEGMCWCVHYLQLKPPVHLAAGALGPTAWGVVLLSQCTGHHLGTTTRAFAQGKLLAKARFCYFSVVCFWLMLFLQFSCPAKWRQWASMHLMHSFGTSWVQANILHCVYLGRAGILYCFSVQLWLCLPSMEVKITCYVGIVSGETASPCNLSNSFNIWLISTLVFILVPLTK